MDKRKLNNYALTASVHTLSVRSSAKPSIPFICNEEAIKSSYYSKKDSWFTKINLNLLYGDIFKYSEFKLLSEKLFVDMGIKDCTYWRTDIRLDSYEDNFYDYYKLNLLLINLFSILFNDRNGQAISHMLTQSKELSDISAKNQYWEVKYYNKKFQTNDTDPAKARLEFRSLKSVNMLGHQPEEIKAIWFKKLNSIIPLYDKVQDDCNNKLLIAYRNYCNYSNTPERDMLTNFFSEYVNGMTIFTRKQLENFLRLCGVREKTLKDRCDYICSKYKMEFFSKKDLVMYIEKIKNSMEDFFLS